jgi:hypothetical protein
MVLIGVKINNGNNVGLVNFKSYLEIQQSPIRLEYTATKANTSYLFTKFTAMPAEISWFNTTVYIKATSFFGQLYSKAVND